MGLSGIHKKSEEIGMPLLSPNDAERFKYIEARYHVFNVAEISTVQTVQDEGLESSEVFAVLCFVFVGLE